MGNLVWEMLELYKVLVHPPKNRLSDSPPEFDLVAYEFYWIDPLKGFELIGILPERRKNPTRITEESVMNWGKMLFGNNGCKKGFFYKKVTITEYTGKFFRVTPANISI